AGAQRIDALRARVVVALDDAVLDRLQDRLLVALLGAPELVLAVDDDDVVLLRQADRVLDRRIAGADDDDRLAFVFVRIVELVLDERQVLAGHAELADVALQADAEDDEVAFDRMAVRALQLEA